MSRRLIEIQRGNEVSYAIYDTATMCCRELREGETIEFRAAGGIGGKARGTFLASGQVLRDRGRGWIFSCGPRSRTPLAAWRTMRVRLVPTPRQVHHGDTQAQREKEDGAAAETPSCGRMELASGAHGGAPAPAALTGPGVHAGVAGAE